MKFQPFFCYGPRVDFELYPHLELAPVVCLGLAWLALQRVPPGLGLVVMVKVAEGQRDATQELINTEEVPVEDCEDNLGCVPFSRDPTGTKMCSICLI